MCYPGVYTRVTVRGQTCSLSDAQYQLCHRFANLVQKMGWRFFGSNFGLSFIDKTMSMELSAKKATHLDWTRLAHLDWTRFCVHFCPNFKQKCL
jgi:hypothetical protein